MNIFKWTQAHRNPIVDLVKRIKECGKEKKTKIALKLIALFVRVTFLALPMMIYFNKLLCDSYAHLRKFKKEKDLVKDRKKEVSVVVVNWNGEALLKPCLNNLYFALSKIEGNHEVIFVDNGSTDNSIETIKREGPQIKVVALKKNTGFSIANNIGIRKASKDLIMLLNNDLLVPENIFVDLLKHFDDSSVFAVSPKVVTKDGTLNEGHSWSEYKNSMLYFLNERQFRSSQLVQRPVLSLYPMGGCAIMDRNMYWSFGGLDQMFSPFCWEDDDIGYRALKRGYKVIYDPTVTAVHDHSSTMKSEAFTTTYVEAVKEKNMTLFFLKNITYQPYLREYIKGLKTRLSSIKERQDDKTLIAFFMVALQIGEVLRRRVKEAPWIKYTDKEIALITQRERKQLFTTKQKPKILVVTPFLPFPTDNGGAKAIYNRIKNTNDKYDFTLLSFIEDKKQIMFEGELKKIFSHVTLVERKPTPVNSLNSGELPNDYRNHITLSMERAFKEILTKQRIDLVQLEYAWMAYYAQFTANVPTILWEHDVGSMFYGKSFTRAEKGLERITKPLKAINYTAAFIDSCDRVIAVTSKDKSALEVLFPSASVACMEVGVDLDLFPYIYKSEGKKNIIYLGNYRHYPNEDAVDYFVEKIFPIIKEQEKEAVLHIVGASPTRRINRLRAREDIRVTGSVDDVNKYLQKGMVFIAPIRMGAGIKTKLLEAMSAGLPVVASPVAAEGLKAKRGEEILVGANPKKFAQHVLNLMSNRELREKVSMSGRKYVEEQFDWRVQAKKIEPVYHELLGGRQ